MSCLPDPGRESDDGQGDGRPWKGWGWRPGQEKEGLIGEGQPQPHDGPVKEKIPSSSHPPAAGEEVEDVLHLARTKRTVW